MIRDYGFHRSSWKFFLVTLAAALIAVAASGCGNSAPQDRPGHGVVDHVDRSARTITLSHEDIPGFMKGMTMTFQVDSNVRLDEVDPGSEVDFRVKEENGIYTVTQISGSGS